MTPQEKRKELLRATLVKNLEKRVIKLDSKIPEDEDFGL